jgi:formate dehydrogenase major subunit
VPGLGTTLGRGGATTPQWDLVNSDCIVIQGSDMAEAHPVAFRFVVQARERGATVIHVDPRFSRTSALADLHVPIRPGSDVALLGGLISYAIERERYFREYVVAYTNAATILRDDFEDTEDLDGLFSGFDAERREYDPGSWAYQVQAEVASPPEKPTEHGPASRGVRPGAPRDETLRHPRCVFQILRRHFSRYTPEVVEDVCGIPPQLFRRVAEALCGASGRDRTAAFCYAVGWTQHTTGVQTIRAAGILQLLLGNIGRPGGGILALRGHATIQGSTDIPTLYDLLPGYLPMPDARRGDADLADYLSQYPTTGWMANAPGYVVSLLRAWHDAPAEEAFARLPRIVDDHSHIPTFLRMRDGGVRGLFVMGQNPAVGGQNARLQRRALAELDFLVVRDFFETETAAFWQRAPEVVARDVKTEVFFLPAAAALEKDGSYTNTHRLVQWHDKAVDPPDECRSEAWFMIRLGRRLKELYADSAEPRDRGFRSLTWDYPTRGPTDEPDVEAVLAEINGWTLPDRRPVAGFEELKDDGSTACGCWIYAGIRPAEGRNLARARQADPEPAQPPGPNRQAPSPFVHHLGWGFASPANRRVLYNRASADPSGRPWSEAKRLIAWDAEQGRWTGSDVPDFPLRKAPDAPGDPDGRGVDAHSGADPFLMQGDGRGWLFAPTGLKDGPLPTHYEPVESPVGNMLYGQAINPVADLWPRDDNQRHREGDRRYPYVITTYRLTEHHTAGAMTRWLPWLAELQPALFCEIGSELAAEKGVRNGDWVTISTARGEVEARALVTERIKPLRLGRRRVHQVGLPWHWGYQGLSRGDVANDLTALVADPNVTIHEAKAFTCDLRPGRRLRRVEG